jgi:outer membrane biosynthesis protein TonB
VVFESYIGGQHYRDAPRLKGCERTVNGRHYTLCAEDDSVTLRLPRAPLEPGYRVRMVPRTNDPVVREILSSGQITVPKLRQLPGARLDTTVNVQLYRQADDGRIEICSSYNEHIRAELCETTAQPPAAPPEQPAPLPQQPAPPPPAQPQPTQTQTQQQNQTVIVNPPAEAPPAPQPVPQHAPQPIPPPHPVPPPTIPQASYTHPFLFSGRIGADQLSTKVSLAQKNAFCNLPDCNVVPLSQTFRASPAYGLNFQYNKKTLNASVDATGSEMKLKSANLDANGNAATLLPTGIERQTVSADAVKTFKTGWRVRPGVNAGGSYTRVKLTDPRSHATNNLWAGYIGGAAVYGNQARSHVTATGGYSSQDVQVLYVAPTFNNTSMPSANIRPFYGQVGGRQLLWKDHIDLYGKFRAYTAADTKYGSSQLRVSNNQNYNAGLRFWINPQSKVSFAPGVEYNGWRQKITSGSSHRSITDNALYGSINVEFGGKEEIRQP